MPKDKPEDLEEFLQAPLSPSSTPSFLLVGEDHHHSSGLIALAHCATLIKEAIEAGKNVVVLTEDLPEKKGWFGRETEYSKEDLQAKRSVLGPDDEAALALHDSGVHFFGFWFRYLRSFCRGIRVSVHNISTRKFTASGDTITYFLAPQ
jgi:hypothetical protein